MCVGQQVLLGWSRAVTQSLQSLEATGAALQRGRARSAPGQQAGCEQVPLESKEGASLVCLECICPDLLLPTAL